MERYLIFTYTYKPTLHITLPFFRLHKLLFEKGEFILKDKRVKNVQLTKKGIDIMIRALDRIISFEDDYFSKLDNKEQKEFARLLNKLLD